MVNIIEETKKLNKEALNGKVDISKISFSWSGRMTRTFGYFQVYRGTQSIVLSKLLLNDLDQLKNTIVHELIHAFQFQHRLPAGHGPSFKKLAQEVKLNSKGKFVITTTTRLSKDSELSKVLEKKREKKLSNQYMIIHKNKKQVNFIRNLKPFEIQFLQHRGFIVQKMKTPVKNISHVKNFAYLIMWAKHYPIDRIRKYIPELTLV